MKYKVISDNDWDEFQKRVNLYLEEGWKPQGGISVVGSRYYQAIVIE